MKPSSLRSGTWSYRMQARLLETALSNSDHLQYLDELAEAFRLIPGAQLVVVATTQARSTHMVIRAVAHQDQTIAQGVVNTSVVIGTPQRNEPGSTLVTSALDEAISHSALQVLGHSLGLQGVTTLPIYNGERVTGAIIVLTEGQLTFAKGLAATLLVPRRIAELGWLLRRSKVSLNQLRHSSSFDAGSFSRVLSVLPIGAVLVDQELNITQANPAFLRMGGYEFYEIRSTYLPNYFMDDPDTKPQTYDAIRLGQTRTLRKPRLLRTKSGERCRIFTSVSPVGGSAASPKYRLVLVEDVEGVFSDLEHLRRHEQLVGRALQPTPIGLLQCGFDGEVHSFSGGLAEELASDAPGERNLLQWLGSLGVSHDISTQIQRRDQFDFTLTYRGRDLLFRSHRVTVEDEGAEFRSIVILIVDISETESAKRLSRREASRNRAITELTRTAIDGVSEARWIELVRREIASAIAGSHITLDADSDPLSGLRTAEAPQGESFRFDMASETIAHLNVSVDRALEPEERHFIEAVRAIATVRMQILDYEMELERISSIDRQFNVSNRRSFMEFLASWNTASVDQSLQGILIHIANAEDLRESVGIEIYNAALREWIDGLRDILSQSIRPFALAYNEFALLAEVTESSSAQTALTETLQAILRYAATLMEISGIALTLRVKVAGRTLTPDKYFTYQDFYDDLQNNLSTSRITNAQTPGSALVRSSTRFHQSGLRQLTRYFYGEASNTVFEPAIDLTTQAAVLYEAKTPVRTIAGLPNDAGSSVSALLASGLISHIEQVELSRLIRFAQSSGESAVRYTINASPRSLLCGRLYGLAESIELPRRARIGFEISERLLSRCDVGRLREEVLKIASLGAEVILDEVGRGFSSFVLLRDVPFSALKLSHHLYNRGDPTTGHILTILVKLASELGMIPIATGVYTAETSEYLGTIGAMVQQGIGVSGHL